MKLTQEMLEEYVQNECCPNCHADEELLDYMGMIENAVSVHCNNCGESWQILYIMTGMATGVGDTYHEVLLKNNDGLRL